MPLYEMRDRDSYLLRLLERQREADAKPTQHVSELVGLADGRGAARSCDSDVHGAGGSRRTAHNEQIWCHEPDRCLTCTEVNRGPSGEVRSTNGHQASATGRA